MNQQLTKNQHIHAKCCIEKFAFNKLGVEVRFIANQPSKQRYYHPKNKKVFTGYLWGQCTELNDQRIEQAFHREINNAIRGLDKPRNHKAISDYHLLWWARHYYRHNPNKDQKMLGIPNHSLSSEVEINLESNGYMFANNGVMHARFLTSVMLQGFRISKMYNYEGLQWSLIESQDGKFIVADCYRDTLFMPISPTKAFAANHNEGINDGIVTKENVAQLNRLSISLATQYYFSSDLSECPT